MKFKLLTSVAALAVIGTSAVSATEFRNPTGLYLGGRLGGGEFSIGSASGHDGGALSFIVGWANPLTDTIGARAEFELSAMYFDDSFMTVKLETTVVSAMANGYIDFFAGHRVRPFVGVGLGFAGVSQELSVAGIKIGDHSESGIAWSVATGIGFNVVESVVMDLGFRYKSISVSGGDNANTFMFNIGARYQF